MTKAMLIIKKNFIHWRQISKTKMSYLLLQTTNTIRWIYSLRGNLVDNTFVEYYTTHI